MKMHLLNILSHLHASDEEREAAKEYFRDKVVSYATARFFIETLRSEKVTPR
jgi:hydroxymethylglutaryl-CoA reductase